MASSLVLTVIGPDRPGLVESIAEAVASHGGNWIESRMSHLSGQFAGLLRVALTGNATDALVADLERLVETGLRVHVAADTQPPAEASAHTVALELVGQDRPGIVREVSRALATRGVNVEDLETWCSSAPMSGEALFHARASLRLPTGAVIDELRAALEQLGDELMVDVSLEPGSRPST